MPAALGAVWFPIRTTEKLSGPESSISKSVPFKRSTNPWASIDIRYDRSGFPGTLPEPTGGLAPRLSCIGGTFHCLQRSVTKANDPVNQLAHPPISAVDSRGNCSASASFSDGVIHSRVCRGRPLKEWAEASRSAWVWMERSAPFGKYWRSSPLVVSLLPRCHGDFGLQKQTWTPVSNVNWA